MRKRSEEGCDKRRKIQECGIDWWRLWRHSPWLGSPGCPRGRVGVVVPAWETEREPMFRGGARREDPRCHNGERWSGIVKCEMFVSDLHAKQDICPGLRLYSENCDLIRLVRNVDLMGSGLSLGGPQHAIR